MLSQGAPKESTLSSCYRSWLIHIAQHDSSTHILYRHACNLSGAIDEAGDDVHNKPSNSWNEIARAGKPNGRPGAGAKVHNQVVSKEEELQSQQTQGKRNTKQLSHPGLCQYLSPKSIPLRSFHGRLERRLGPQLKQVRLHGRHHVLQPRPGVLQATACRDVMRACVSMLHRLASYNAGAYRWTQLQAAPSRTTRARPRYLPTPPAIGAAQCARGPPAPTFALQQMKRTRAAGGTPAAHAPPTGPPRRDSGR